MPPARVDAPAPPPKAVAPAVGPGAQELIQATLRRYREAYANLDASAAGVVWPSVDQAALAGAFRDLESQAIRFDWCDVQVRGDDATASCGGSATYVPRVGARQRHVEPRLWTFTLRQAMGNWMIQQVDVRQTR